MTRNTETESRSVDEIQGEIELTADRIREVSREISALLTERDELNDRRAGLQDELLKALGEQLRIARESQS
jgi:uncharacterized coiled-coil DUF342 family protein